MPSIGVFDAAMEEVEAVDDPKTFEWYGTVIHLQPQISAYAFLKFARFAGEIDMNSDEQLGAIQMVSMFDTLRDVIVPEDWPAFETIIREKRVGLPVLMRLSAAITEAYAGRPTAPPSDSDGGRSGAGKQSNGRQSGRGSGKRSRRARETQAAKSATVRAQGRTVQGEVVEVTPEGMRPVQPGDERFFPTPVHSTG